MPSTLASKRNASKSTNLASSPRPYGAFFIAQILEEAMYIENDDKICMNCQHRIRNLILDIIQIYAVISGIAVALFAF